MQISTIRSPKKLLAGWQRCVTILASSGGICHDIGKFNHFFQKKLSSPTPIRDPVSHEWVSMDILRKKYAHFSENKQIEMKDCFGQSLDVNIPANFKSPIFNSDNNLAIESLNYVVATHHRLLEDTDFPSNGKHVKNDHDLKDLLADPAADFSFIEPMINKAIIKMDKLGRTYDFSSDGWRLISVVARAALILADHHTSSIRYPGPKFKGAIANTKPNLTTGERKPDQPLDWHLDQVSKMAAEFSYKMVTWSPEGLDERSVSAIEERSDHPDYQWQDQAYDKIRQFSRLHETPSLIFNLASTGSGKTKMNAKAIVAASVTGVVRFSAAFNLKSLTLQTSDAYKHQLKINPKSIATIIGDISTAKLHQSNQSGLNHFFDEDGNQEDPEYIIQANQAENVPDWLKKSLDGKYRMLELNMSAILISTVDWLVSAGNPGASKTHGAALIRAMHNDLILDEIDSYEPEALSCVLNLVMLAGMFGRNVVASSATLSKPVADALYGHYKAGAMMRADAKISSGSFSVALISDKLAPEIEEICSTTHFSEYYDHYLREMLKSIATQPVYRLANHFNANPDRVFIDENEKIRAHAQRISAQIELLHENNHTLLKDKKVSFGLIRVANIKHAINLSQQLDQIRDDSVFCCYHSQLKRIHRSEIERRLDFLLSRKNSDTHLSVDDEIVNILESKTGDNVCFIVVATAVEEVGRDHDFDWAIIEPSSSQSIIQTAGRVNRHRKVSVTKPNIAIMDNNWRKATAKSDKKPCFVMPGFERSEDLYQSHHIQELFNWNDKNELVIDATVRLNGLHDFSNFDDRSISEGLKSKTKYALPMSDKYKFAWYSSVAYKDLRSHQKRTNITLIPGEPMKVAFYVDRKNAFLERGKVNLPKAKNPWMSYSDDYFIAAAAHAKISNEDAFGVSVSGDFCDENVIKEIRYHPDFGVIMGNAQ